MPVFPKPRVVDDLRGTLLRYLDFYRGVIADKVAGLPGDQLQESRVPSGWSPAGLVNHLVNVERRWLDWGFAGEDLGDPWRDQATRRSWVAPRLTGAGLRTLLEERGRATRELVERHDLTETARVGGRFSDPAEAPDLQGILLHLVQEYARHAGHLDIVRELIDGELGEN
ncbi:DinB family protein [Granulicoccus sp. GXG6511]|uniref:DinB family protein n=1 Tax=Granulicoccus sp. GXG6511 TaxID=3381351 RepID=UPI003D7DD61D